MHGRWIYFFGQGRADGGSEVKDLVGGKGASLADMTRAGLNVPPGFTLSAECCAWYFAHERTWPDDLDPALRAALSRLEQISGRTFGHGDRPLLVAVRSGAAESMPGMMDTVLNVGLNPDCVRASAARHGDGRSVWETYLHFQRMFAHTVGGIDKPALAELWRRYLHETGKAREEELDAAQLEVLSGRVAAAYRAVHGQDFPTDPWALLCAAINAVFESWHGERAVTYRRDHGIDDAMGTAVNVQIMCPSEVSGVLFTANPVDASRKEIVIESAFGLGETVVLGDVTPDRFTVERDTLTLRERNISVKERRVAALTESPGTAVPGLAHTASLSDEQVQELARLGLRVEEYFKTPCDIEWGLSQGQFYLLQSRPIRFGAAASAAGIDPAERDRVRREEIEALRTKMAPGGTVWSRYILAEILPEPTPMSWAVVRRLMGVRGGYGLMYQDLGFEPDPALGDDGIFDLVCGRPYCNLSREPRIQYRSLPFQHPFDQLKQDPQRALRPKAVLKPNWRFFLTFPFIFVKMTRGAALVQGLQQRFADEFEQRILPPYTAEVERATAEDWSNLSGSELIQRFEHWSRRVLVEFARHSLKPTALAEMQMASLAEALTRRLLPSGEPLGPSRADAALRELLVGIAPGPAADLEGALVALQQGRLTRREFLGRFGHRGADEMELAAPRFADDERALELLLPADGVAEGPSPDPEAARQAAWQRLIEAAQLQLPAERAAVEKQLGVLQRLIGLREAAKHHLLRGYALLRRTLVELDRRHGLDGGIFYLTPEELPRLESGTALQELIAARRRRRAVALSLFVPHVLFSDDLEAIDRPPAPAEGGTLQGVPLSSGIAEGQALVIEDVRQARLPQGDFILVCPKTDPAWVRLVRQARGLVMETGGVLSHGAIVARSYNKPAVAGIPDVLRRVKTGQRLRIDGATGQVLVLS